MDTLVGILNYLVFFSITAGIYAVLTLGLNIQWGYTGLFNIGIAGFYAIGAYTSALLAGPPPGSLDWRVFGGWMLPFPVGLLGSALVSAVLALFIGWITIRLREDYLAIATIGIAEVLRLIIKNEAWLTNGVWGIKNIPSPLFPTIQRGVTTFLSAHPSLPDWAHRLLEGAYNWFYLALVLALLFLLYWSLERILRSPWGRVLRAIREDEVAAAAQGKNVTAFKLQAFVLGAALMGMAGSLYAHYARFLSVEKFEPFYGTFIVWVMLVAGGSGNNKGAILGAFLIWGLWAATDFLTGYLPFTDVQTSALRIVLVGLILIAILILRPRGILGEEKFVSRMLR
ncbi:branched-chain amino acid ABC transporter permease [Candidatus Bipolaricaulota sp. J31]